MKHSTFFLILLVLLIVLISASACSAAAIAPTSTPTAGSKNITGTETPTPEPLVSPVRVSSESIIEGDASEPTVPYSFKVSPDGRRFADIIDTGSKQIVEVNGVKQKAYDSIIVPPIFSPDSQRIAYLAQRGGQEFLVVDGKEYQAYAQTTDWYYGPEVHFSPDSRHIAYVATKGGNQVVVLDGVESKPYDQIFALTFNPNNRSVAFWGKTGEQWFVVNNNQAGKAYDPMDCDLNWDEKPLIVFNDDGTHIAYCVRVGAKTMLVIDGKEGKLYDIPGDYVFSPDWTRVANEIESKGYERVEDITLSPDGKHLMYRAKMGDTWTMFTDGQAGAKYEELGNPIFSPDSRRTAYQAKAGDGWTVVLDGKEQKLYDGIAYRSLRFSPDSQHVAYTAAQNNKELVVLDGQESAPYDLVLGALVFSPNSQHLGYAAQQGTQWFVMIDGKAGAGYDLVVRPFRPFIDADDATFFDTDNSWHYLAASGEDLYLVEEKFVSSPEAAAAHQTATAIAAVNETKIAAVAPTRAARRTATAAAEAQKTVWQQAKITETAVARVNQTATAIAKLELTPTIIPAQATATADAASNILQASNAWQVIITDKFDDNGNSWPASYEKSISNGKYVWNIEYINYMSESWPNMPAQIDFAASVNVRLESGSSDCGMGLIFGSRENAHIFYIHDNRRWVSGTTHYLRPEISRSDSSTAIVPGTPNRLTLIAQGDRLMFWVNGEYVGQTQNTLVKQGKVGVVARNLEGSGCRVSFDNFELRMPLKVLAQQTPSMVAGQRVLAKAQQWKSVLADTFDSNVNEWPVEFYNKRFTPPDLLATAVIERGVYHPKQVNELKLLPFRGLAIPKQASTAKDVFVSVESRQHTVDEAWPPKYGLAFRVNESQDKYYAFVIDEVNGEFQLIVEDGSDASFFPPLAKGNSAAIRRGETNRLAVIAQGNLIKLFINDQLVTQVKDEQLTSGNAGIAFWGDWMRDYDVEFDNFQVRVP